MVKALRPNCKRVSNDQPIPHVDEKQAYDSQPNDAPNASEMSHGEQVEANAGEHALKKGRGHTINAKLQQIKAKRMTKGKTLDIQFPSPYYKVCGKHAKLFKSEATVCIRQRAPVQVNSWKKITEGELDAMWKHMKEQLCLSDEVKEYAMKQVQYKYKNRHHNLHKAYLHKKGRPNDVSPEDWDWLVNNKWSDPKFQEKSLKNQVNRSKQEIKSITGTKSIVQKAFDMKEDPKSDEWPDAVKVWRSTRMRANGTWCVPNGDQIMNDLKNVGEAYQEEISKAPVPLVEHFALVLGRKPNHSLGVGSAVVTKKFTEKQLIKTQVETAQRRASDLELEVQKLTEITKKQEEANIQLQAQLHSQREMIDAQRVAFESQQDQMKQQLEEEMKRQMAAFLGRLSFNGHYSGSSAPSDNDQNP